MQLSKHESRNGENLNIMVKRFWDRKTVRNNPTQQRYDTAGEIGMGESKRFIQWREVRNGIIS